MIKQKVAIDVDDVIGAENEAIRKFINREYLQNHTAEDYLVDGDYWSYWQDIWKVSEDEAERRLEAFLKSPDKDSLEILDGAIKVIGELKKTYDLVIVTSRYGRQLETTEPWLEKHFPKTFSQVAFVATWSRDEKVTKAKICNDIGANYLIDDNADHCNLAAQAGIKSLLFGDYGWNRKATLHPGVTRVKDWHKVLSYFQSLDS
jgi:5'(3')-deoxyribonucleotidase